MEKLYKSPFRQSLNIKAIYMFYNIKIEPFTVNNIILLITCIELTLKNPKL